MPAPPETGGVGQRMEDAHLLLIFNRISQALGVDGSLPPSVGGSHRRFRPRVLPLEEKDSGSS